MILLISKNLTRESFIAAAKVEPGSYMEALFNRVYDALTSEIMSLQEDYTQYYADEYDKFESYLYRKQNLSSTELEDFCEQLRKNPYLDLYESSSRAYGDYSLENFIYSDDLYPTLEKIIQTNYDV